ncbi:MAG: hypothetical protein R6U96_12795 [Promethearchaeia archaeon]
MGLLDKYEGFEAKKSEEDKEKEEDKETPAPAPKPKTKKKEKTPKPKSPKTTTKQQESKFATRLKGDKTLTKKEIIEYIILIIKQNKEKYNLEE